MINQKQILSISFFVFLIFVLVQLLRIFSPFFDAIFWGLILTFAFFPLHQRFRRNFANESGAALCTTGVILLIVLVPGFFIIARLLEQTLELYEWVRSGQLGHLIASLKDHPWFETLYHKAALAPGIEKDFSLMADRIAKTAATFARSQAITLTKNILLVFLNFIVVVFLLFFFFRDGKKIMDYLYKLVPLEGSDKKTVFGKINETFASVIRGQLLTSLCQSATACLVFSLLGIRAPLFFGFLTFVATFIPVFGTSIVWVPLAFFLVLKQEFLRAGILFVVGAGLISTMDNIIKPIVIGERMKIPVFLLFLGVVGGLKTYGMTGIFLGPLFISLFFALAKIYQERYFA